jgi:hypothetical protein
MNYPVPMQVNNLPGNESVFLTAWVSGLVLATRKKMKFRNSTSNEHPPKWRIHAEFYQAMQDCLRLRNTS